MKIILHILSILFALSIVACSDENSDQNVPNNDFSRKGTIQGTIFDATTGARINSSSLSVTLVQGTKYRSPDVLKNSASDTLFAGDFAFKDVPLTLAGNIVYRIVAIATGYQQFETYFTPTANVAANNTIDDTHNYIGNIYMFPLGAQASSMTVNVMFNGEAVSGATVYLQRITSNNDEPTIVTDTDGAPFPAGELNIEPDVFRLPAASGLLANLTATTDTNGVATFAASTLVLGGQYRVVVMPMAYNGVQLALNVAGGNITIGTSTIIQNVAMADLEPGANNGLYIVSNSNQDTNNIQSNGVLTITFNRAVTLINEPLITAVLGGTIRSAVLDASAAGTEVTGALSTDGLVLTLTPNFSTALVAFDGTNGASAGTPTADINLTVTYNNVFVTITGGINGGTAHNVLVNLTGQVGTSISSVVNLTGPEDF